MYFQGHPEYDTISLLKEYKREVDRFVRGEREDYPPFPENYFSLRTRGILAEHHDRLLTAAGLGEPRPELPEALISGGLHNTWHDTAEAVIDNWVGKVYQITNNDRRLPFMPGVDPNDPLGLKL